MSFSGNKRKGAPGDVLDEERMPADPADPAAGTLRAGGKRVRKKRDINSWTVSIPTNRRNILCLGMSYPHVDWVVRNFKLPKNTKPIVLFNQEPSVEQAIELVRRNILNQIDGRDLARINALEADNDKLAYTVSKEQAAVWYEKRHLHADFNSRNLVNQMVLKWGKTVRFHQVILDYFWSPSGSWAIKSWQRSFFNENIPNFVTHKLFNFGSLDKDTTLVKPSAASKKKKRKDSAYLTSDAAVVYLPFSSHCFRQVVACYENLSKFYTISFLKKEDLDEHTLWKATNTISPSSMQVWLAKSIDQEEKYCKLDYSEIRGFSDDEFATREDIINIFNRIAEPDEVRMIKLMALRKYHPDYPSSNMKPDKPTLGIDKGGYVGLIHPSEVVLRRTPSPTDGIVTKKTATKEAATITNAVDADPLKESNSAVPRFILSLAELLDRKNRKIIELIPDGITIHDEGRLETELLPNFFTPGSLLNFKNVLRKYKFRRTENKTYTHDALDKDMNVQSLLQINKNGFVRGAPPSVDLLYNNIFGSSGKDITVDVSKDPNFKELMFYHYKMLGKKPAIGLPRQLGGEIFKKLQTKVKKSGGSFLNGRGETIDLDKASRKIMRCLYLRMDTFADWKDYQFAEQENDVSDDESDEKRQSYSITASAETELLTGMANQMTKWKADKKGKPKKGCKHMDCGKPVFARGKCYRHDQESKRAAVDDISSDDEDDNIYPVRLPMRTIGTQTDDLPLVSDTSGHYEASVASDSSSSSDNTTQARGLPKDDTTVDENSSSSSDSSQKPVEPVEPIRRKKSHRAKHAPEPDMPWPDMWRFMRDDGWTFVQGSAHSKLCDFIYLHPSLKGQKNSDFLSNSIEGEDFFTSEGSVMLYARKFLGWRGVGGSESEFPTVLTPVAVRAEHRRKSKQRLDSRSESAANETETDQELEVTEKLDQCTPHTNDVLLVAGHHSHMGNVQFCNAVSMCNVDFTEVPECFSAALKSLSPPGRFLVKAVSDGGWKEISHDLAPSIIPMIMDHHKLNGAHLFRRESLSFLARVERKIESKFGGRPLVAKASSMPSASLPTTAAAAPTPAVPLPATIADTGASTKEAVTNRCIAQTLRTFNIWHDENWRNKMLTAFGVDTSQLGQNGTSLSQLSADDFSQILEQSSLSAHTLLTCVLDAEVKSLVKSSN